MKKQLFKISIRTIIVFFIFGPLSSLFIWSFAKEWYWPSALPQKWSIFYWQKISDGNILNALWLSIIIALITTVVCLVMVIPLAYILSRKKFSLKPLLMLIFLLPQAFPQMPVYVNTMEKFYKYNLVGTLTGVVLIHLTGGLIYCLWIMVSVFKSIPESLELASYNLGYSKINTFFRITLPMAAPGILASSILVFLFSLDEFTGTLLIGSPFVQTLSVFMYNTAAGYEMQIASVVAILLALPGIIMLFLMEKYLKAEYLAGFGAA
ncbi:ABC transporter permease [Clostridium sp. DJ247]|uniref:ABC transporter permease n=1 Tax=Clostridium sp. DJ247 TaxID=2726188 RepID=UPI00162475C3|nr:ABC transporter permease subunit [Clostridium sp. DJ247]MBC2581504.1 ABC transporter permease subunit [Clostridium sp. DJ247]